MLVNCTENYACSGNITTLRINDECSECSVCFSFIEVILCNFYKISLKFLQIFFTKTKIESIISISTIIHKLQLFFIIPINFVYWQPLNKKYEGCSFYTL